MKCSLLTLSTFIDSEMPVERHAEVDAHLVGCPRCTAGVTTLREEKLRIAQLARVRVPAPSATALLESIGVSSTPVVQRSAQTRRDAAPAADARPWLEARSSAALPWTPTRPTSSRPTATPSAPDEDARPAAIPVDVQPDPPSTERRSPSPTRSPLQRWSWR